MSKDKKKDKVEEPKKPKTKKASKKTDETAVAEVAIESTAPPAKPAAKAKAKPKAPARPKKAAPTPEIEISVEEIGLRAYFISERRREHNLPGDETSDWIDAERELRFEIIEKLGINS